LLDIILDCDDLINIEERRRCGLSFVLAWQGIEYDRETLARRRKEFRTNKRIDDSGITTLLQRSFIKLGIRKVENGVVRPKVLGQFDDTAEELTIVEAN
jgi:hypothetical protein